MSYTYVYFIIIMSKYVHVLPKLEIERNLFVV